MDELYAVAAFVWGTRVKYLLVKLFYIVFDAYNKPIPSHSIFSVKKTAKEVLWSGCSTNFLTIYFNKEETM